MTDVAPRFTSLAALRNAHEELRQAHRQQGNSAEMLERITDFIREGRAVGALLDDAEQRGLAQSLLDYWSATLYRAGQEPPDAVLAEFTLALAPELSDALCPYVGLDAFSEANKDVFCGRDGLTGVLLDKLTRERLLVVIGSSGSGKSSLVLAGLLPKLKAGDPGAPSGSQSWRYLPRMVPGSDPLANLARLLSAVRKEAVAGEGPRAREAAARLREDPSRLAQLAGTGEETPVVVVVDQFEEVFTLCRDAEARQAFVASLVNLVEVSGPRHTVILTMRTDFVQEVGRLPGLPDLLQQALVVVTKMTDTELQEAIEKPASGAGLKFDPGLVNRLVQDVRDEPVALPLLQFTLLKLWENRERNRITWEAYRRLGGCREALARTADEFYKSLLEEEKGTARRLFLRLVQPGDGLEFTSRRVQRQELYLAGEASDRVNRVLEKLIAARLVRLTEGDLAADAQVEVAHEALLRNWPTLVTWLEDEREAIRKRQRLTEAAGEWAKLGKDEALLLRGSSLQEALGREDLNEQEREFVQASVARRDEEAAEKEGQRQRELKAARQLAQEAEARRHAERLRAEEANARAREQADAAARLRRTNTALTVSVILVVVLFLVAVALGALAKRYADQQAAESRARKLAWDATSILDVNPTLSTYLALYAVAATSPAQPPPEAVAALHRAVQTAPLRRTLIGHAETVLDVAYGPDGATLATASMDDTVKVWDAVSAVALLTLAGHTGDVNAVACRPDGRLLATASADRTARIWDAASGKELSILRHSGAVNDVAFSADGRYLATASADKTVRVWNVISATEVLSFTGHTAPVLSVAFSSDGRHLATGSADESAKVWDLESGQETVTLKGRAGWVTAVTFSPDGKRLATASADRTARIWDANSGNELRSLIGHTDWVRGVAFSPDGTRLATVSADKTARVWSVASGKEVFTLSGHTAAVWGVAYSPDGQVLATASADRTARTWFVAPGQSLLPLLGHDGWVYGVAYGPRGDYLATAGGDKTAKIWNTGSGGESRTLMGHTDVINGIDFSPDGQYAATASADKTARVWDLRSGALLHTLSGHTGSLFAIACSPDAKHLATASQDGTVKVWNIDSAKEVSGLAGHTGAVWDVAYDPDGKRLATAGADRTARIWDAATGKQTCVLTRGAEATGQSGPARESHDGDVYAVVFSPDGMRLATASKDKTARVWDAGSCQELLTLIGHTDELRSVVFSPTDPRLATAGADGTVKVWNAGSGEPLFTLLGPGAVVRDVAYSPDGKRLVAVGEDGSVRMYTLDITELMTAAKRRLTVPMTPEQCLSFLGEAPCPPLP